MSLDVYSPWIPMTGVPWRLNLASLSDEGAGVVLHLQESVGDGPVYRMIFESPVAYRSVNESYRNRTRSRVDMAALPSLLRVDHSSWVNWLRSEAAGLLDGIELRHYAIFGDEDCVEFVTEFEPNVCLIVGDSSDERRSDPSERSP